MTKPKPKGDLFEGGAAAETPPSDYGAGKDHGAEKHTPRAPARAKRKKPEPARGVTSPRPITKAAENALAKFESPPPMNLLTLIGQAIINPEIDASKLTALVDWYDKREADNAFARDFLAMAKQLPEIKKDGTIDQGITRSGRQGVVSKYATYENIHRATSKILHDHGFTLSSYNRIVGEQTVLVVRLEHHDVRFGSSYRESIQPLVRDDSGGKTAVQSLGSGEAYLMRRMVIKLLNLRSSAKEDRDLDGNDPAKVAAAETKAKADAKPVNAAQLKELREKIAATGGRISEERVCEKYGVEKLEALPMARHLDACKALDNVIEAARG